jgi:hypothetical protein
MNGHSFDSTDWLAEPRLRAARELEDVPGAERSGWNFQQQTN